MTEKTKRHTLRTLKPRKAKKNIMDDEPIIIVVGSQPTLLAVDKEGKTHRITKRFV